MSAQPKGTKLRLPSDVGLFPSDPARAASAGLRQALPRRQRSWRQDPARRAATAGVGHMGEHGLNGPRAGSADARVRFPPAPSPSGPVSWRAIHSRSGSRGSRGDDTPTPSRLLQMAGAIDVSDFDSNAPSSHVSVALTGRSSIATNDTTSVGGNVHRESPRVVMAQSAGNLLAVQVRPCAKPHTTPVVAPPDLPSYDACGNVCVWGGGESRVRSLQSRHETQTHQRVTSRGAAVDTRRGGAVDSVGTAVRPVAAQRVAAAEAAAVAPAEALAAAAVAAAAAAQSCTATCTARRRMTRARPAGLQGTSTRSASSSRRRRNRHTQQRAKRTSHTWSTRCVARGCVCAWFARPPYRHRRVWPSAPH